MPKAQSDRDSEARREAREELLVFLFLTVVLAPLLAVFVVGGYGLLVWLYQAFAGPPSA
ncbi:MAG: hypothetical protein KatS3mg121_0222 [Gammaproteobacteria bacterium]|nr:MAG: hypothetical protein KatS3mg121_0222 [Gammaproteobacteria bacterium]